MTTPQTYHLFIGHAWDYHPDYDRMVRLLKSVPGFQWTNHSFPRDNPLIDFKQTQPEEVLYHKLLDQIEPADVVLMLTSVYYADIVWGREVLQIAQSFEKPILGIRSVNTSRVPVAIRNVAREIVEWDATSIVTAINRYAKKK